MQIFLFHAENNKLKMHNKKADLLFYLSPLFLILSILIQWNVKDYLSYDSQAYIDLAKKLPTISDSLYPIFYPILLRITDFFLNNYLISYKALTILSLSFCFFIVKYYNFFWREFWCLLSFTSFFKLAPWAWSEIIMIPLFIIYLFMNYKILTTKYQKNKKTIAVNIFILLIMTTTKYSSIFILASIIPFCLYLFFRKDKEILKRYIIIFFSALFLILLYLLLNKLNTGELMGQRLTPDFGGQFNLRLSLSFILFNLNPFFHGKENNFLGVINFGWQTAYIFSIVFIATWLYLIRKGLNNKMVILCLTTSLISLGLTLYSYLTTRIDLLNFRLLLPFYFFFFSSIIFSTQSNKKFKNTILIIILSLSIIINFSSILLNHYNS